MHRIAHVSAIFWLGSNQISHVLNHLPALATDVSGSLVPSQSCLGVRTDVHLNYYGRNVRMRSGGHSHTNWSILARIHVQVILAVVSLLWKLLVIFGVLDLSGADSTWRSEGGQVWGCLIIKFLRGLPKPCVSFIHKWNLHEFHVARGSCFYGGFSSIRIKHKLR